MIREHFTSGTDSATVKAVIIRDASQPEVRLAFNAGNESILLYYKGQQLEFQSIEGDIKDPKGDKGQESLSFSFSDISNQWRNFMKTRTAYRRANPGDHKTTLIFLRYLGAELVDERELVVTKSVNQLGANCGGTIEAKSKTLLQNTLSTGQIANKQNRPGLYS